MSSRKEVKKMNKNYAGVGTRFIALLIDAIILWVVQVIISMVLSQLLRDNVGLTLLINLAISVGYFVVYQESQGQTLGKKVMKIKVVDAQGKKPTMMTFFLREIIGKFVSGIILGIGYLMAFWDGNKQALHDKIASTYVVKV